MKEAGYIPYGSYRFCKMVRRVDGMVMTEDEAKAHQFYELSYLFVDMMVDNVHPQHKQVFGSNPLDEPLAARVYENGDVVRQSLDDFEFHIPAPASLLATKLRSIPKRQSGDKLWKDACDIYSIIWHSSVDYSSVIDEVRKEHGDDCTEARKVMTDEVVTRAAYHIGITNGEFTSVVDLLDK